MKSPRILRGLFFKVRPSGRTGFALIISLLCRLFLYSTVGISRQFNIRVARELVRFAGTFSGMPLVNPTTISGLPLAPANLRLIAETAYWSKEGTGSPAMVGCST
jgi:hypothetical protein